ncbi:MAG TPA: glycosyltransferase family 39 protein [Anaerolineae bacterium]|nr:glycosyltransferase family 39 protein [Anaerolineae bacterium]
MLKAKPGRAEWLVVALVVLLALFLRFYLLGRQSLWADEGNSAALARRTLSTITRDAARDIHPPFYYYLLHFWVRLWGNSEVALRSLSALSGTALVFTTYLLGRRLFTLRVGLIAAFLAAISPFQIQYSQETRMYILVSLWSVLSVLFFVACMHSWTAVGDAAGRRATPSAILYVVFTTAALYTHYFAFTVPLVTNLAYALGMIAYPFLRRPRRLVEWALAQVVILALFFPWLRLAGRQLTTWPAVSEPISIWSLARELIRVFSLGLSVEPVANPAVFGFGLLLLLGALPCVLWPSARRGGWLPGLLPRHTMDPLLFTLLYLCVPILAMYLLSLTRPAYDPKFLLLVTPAFFLLLARGIGAEWLGRMSRRRAITAGRWAVTGLLLFLVVAATVPSLSDYYFDERYARDDYRGIASYITAAGQDGDAIILNAPGQIDIFSYYYHGQLPIYPLPGQRPLDENETEAALNQILARHRHLYVLFWGTDESDPGRFLEGWLDQRTFKALDSWHGNVRLAIYAVPQEEISEEIQHPLELAFGESILLSGYSISSSEVRAGDILQLTLFWQARGEMGERYKVFTHVLDGRSHIVGQRDGEPVGGTRPTNTWKAGEIIADNYGVLVLPGTPPGQHHLEIGMYNLETGERLSISEAGEVVGDHILLEPIQVLQPEAPPPIEALGIQHRGEQDFGPVRLLGYNLSKLGFEHQPDEPVHPGDTIHLTLFWQAVAEIDTDFTLTLELQDQAGNVVVSRDVKPAGGAHPPTAWGSGEIIRDQHSLLLPGGLPAGRYELFVDLQGLDIAIGQFHLASLPI